MILRLSTAKLSSGNPIKLYDPHEILNLKSVDNQYSNDEKVEHKLYGQIERDSIDEDGFVTRCNGDVETLEKLKYFFKNPTEWFDRRNEINGLWDDEFWYDFYIEHIYTVDLSKINK